MTMTASFKIIVIFGGATLTSTSAFAENCRAMPFGPDRKACVMREHPAQFEAKQQRCKQLALQRGFIKVGGASGNARGMKEFVMGCMQGKQG
jgi:hypothetical protein